MNIKELTVRMNQLVEAKGWYDPQSARPQTPRNLAISLSLEAAELLENFQWNDQCQDSSALKEELADVALYLLQIASVSGIDLEKAILQKLEINHKRVWDKPPESARTP
ncbi:MAG: nucleotide pyrophosphohydrolase [Chloroflexi bacterium]|nr:nucleotide pyrophosphohydrolase [Chloroflexota bacterium]